MLTLLFLPLGLLLLVGCAAALAVVYAALALAARTDEIVNRCKDDFQESVVKPDLPIRGEGRKLWRERRPPGRAAA